MKGMIGRKGLKRLKGFKGIKGLIPSVHYLDQYRSRTSYSAGCYNEQIQDPLLKSKNYARTEYCTLEDVQSLCHVQITEICQPPISMNII